MLQAAEKIKQCFCSASTEKSRSASVSDASSTGDDGDAAGEQTERSEQYDFDENKDRGNWAGRLDFILTLLGSVSQGRMNQGHLIGTEHNVMV